MISAKDITIKKRVSPNESNKQLWHGLYEGKKVVCKSSHSYIHLKKELDIYKKIRDSGENSYILKYYGFANIRIRRVTYKSIIVEEMNTTLDLFISKNKPSLKEKIDYCIDIAKGMQFLAKNGIMHLDLKLENFLCKQESDKLKVVIADFDNSLSVDFNNEKNSFVEVQVKSCGNLAAQPPELHQQNKKNRQDTRVYISFDYDIYSYGVAIWELLSERHVDDEDWGTYGCDPYEDFYLAVIKGGRPDTEGIGSERLKELICDCWSYKKIDKIWLQPQRPRWEDIIDRLEKIKNVLIF